jgi:hypothetical protein
MKLAYNIVLLEITPALLTFDILASKYQYGGRSKFEVGATLAPLNAGFRSFIW